MLSNFKKSDSELQIVWGEVYAPDVPDSQHDVMSSTEILKMAYSWMAKSNTRCIDKNHDQEVTNAFVVESFIARKGDPDFIEGAWVVGVHIPDPALWEKVKKGELNGFSMQGRSAIVGTREVTVPAEVTGLTKAECGHSHNFSVAYAPDGEFIGGCTDEVDGHFHVIRRGTVTEEANGHVHKFDYVRGVLADEEAGHNQGA